VNVSLSPALKRFVDEQVTTGRYVDASEVIRQALRLMQSRTHIAALDGAANEDIMALAFIVLMEAAKSAREDLRAIMEGVKAINAAKQGWRDLRDKVGRDVAANDRVEPGQRPLDFSRGMGSERGYHHARVPRLDPDCPGGVCFEEADLHPAKIERVEDLRIVAETVKNRLDSLSEMGEMESLRLQMAMDRLSKLMATLSNVLRKSSDAAASIIDNLK
jgi:putative addiction module CopG family antidote